MPKCSAKYRLLRIYKRDTPLHKRGAFRRSLVRKTRSSLSGRNTRADRSPKKRCVVATCEWTRVDLLAFPCRAVLKLVPGLKSYVDARRVRGGNKSVAHNTIDDPERRRAKLLPRKLRLIGVTRVGNTCVYTAPTVLTGGRVSACATKSILISTDPRLQRFIERSG